MQQPFHLLISLMGNLILTPNAVAGGVAERGNSGVAIKTSRIVELRKRPCLDNHRQCDNFSNSGDGGKKLHLSGELLRTAADPEQLSFDGFDRLLLRQISDIRASIAYVSAPMAATIL
jgi:hypothetical protein